MPRTSHQRDPAYSPSGRRYSLEPGSPVRRSKRLEHGSPSPTPFALRATTPDARQLHETLRAASESPSKERPDTRARSSAHSSVTPSPPVQRTISSTSTPAPPSLNPAITAGNETLEPQTDRGFSFFRYPRLPSIGFGRKEASIVLSSPEVEDDNASVVSWQLERELHRDNLQRTKPEPEPESYSLVPREARNIRKPPRRLSGLTWTNDTTHSADNTNTTSNYDDDGKDDDKEDEEDKKSDTSDIRTAAARTVISSNNNRDSADDSVSGNSRPPTSDQSALVDRPRRPPLFNQQDITKETHWSLFLLLMTLFITIFIITTYFLGGYLLSNDLFPHQARNYPTLNTTEGNIVSQLSDELVRLNTQMTSVSTYVHHLSYEQKKIADQVTIVRPNPEFEPRINFLSPGLGTRVDPKLTSPSIGTRRTLPRRLYESLSRKRIPQPNPPGTALEAWNDIGDCWCAAPSKTGQAQLALDLGQRAIIDEVVVEHIPAGASPDPGVAPREMELWARFRPFRGGQQQQQQQQAAKATETAITSESSNKRSGWFGLFRSSTTSSSTSSSSSSLSSILDAIIKTLQQAYPSDPETAYANDRLLGPSYFRLGQWEYDRAGGAVQHFALDALIDYPMVRVDKVVLRVKSNWGGNSTCLYRVKVHGHV
ncbi:conserved hypothetical protein [Talaromyces stipitatus ATCC 10500]|uniref:SUN domain-containing protein n=1 Tax=Talaromyces stipitatus (strain ATCC 10500 / CBS 375.48 / QM 6759 / NRRL 1006) TaxID=441959 RepID=B8MRH8_TALSN|nr:uncharacterized protein TSTA_056140 [Talaromyces stipitatus ATCC 10500]EED13115.1 conserved hypothetical protein [Talaromyces stipitatus ATCC 10500]